MMNGVNTCMLMFMGLVGMMMVVEVASHDYEDALFEGQRSGKLPSTQRITWRKDSALSDGNDIGVDLVGGYYDAGDNVKFSFPMAFTTMLAWSILEFGHLMGSEHKHAQEALKWGTDYFLKATSAPGNVIALVGEPNDDHNCWERPEDMDTLRKSYIVNTTKPGSEVPAEIAAALAASSLVFKSVDSQYSKILLQRAIQVFQFADENQGSYNLSVGEGICPFIAIQMASWYGQQIHNLDELIWGATWLFKATNAQSYWKYVIDNIHSLHKSIYIEESEKDVFVGGSSTEFGWDAKHTGINVLVSRFGMNTYKSDPFVYYADNFICSLLPESPTKSVTYSSGGLMIKPGGSNSQYATALSFVLLAYSRYLTRFNRSIECGDVPAVTVTRLVEVAKGQVDYLLGSNPLNMSYMVGYGKSSLEKYIIVALPYLLLMDIQGI